MARPVPLKDLSSAPGWEAAADVAGSSEITAVPMTTRRRDIVPLRRIRVFYTVLDVAAQRNAKRRRRAPKGPASAGDIWSEPD